MAAFDEYDILFEYPDSWEVSVTGDALERTISVESPDSAFWLMTIYGEPISTLALVQKAAEAFAEEYEGADVTAFESTILDFDADGRQIDFTCLDMIGSARVQAFTTHRRTFFLLGQASDLDESAGDVFDAIAASLRLPTE